MYRKALLLLAVLALSLLLLGGFVGLTLPLAQVRAAAEFSHAGAALQACVTVNTDIVANTTWTGDCYLVTTNTVAIQPGVALTISPPVSGTWVRFEPGAQLQVLGTLKALGAGAATHHITFSSASTDPAARWLGIILEDDAVVDRDIIQYSTIERALTGVKINDEDNVTLLRNVFRYNGGSGARAGAIGGDTDNSVIAHNEIYECQHGIALNESFGNLISDNWMYALTGYGVYLMEDTTSGGSNNLIRDNEIHACASGAVRLEDGSNNNVLNNSVYANPGGALYLSGQALGSVNYNHVYSNGGESAYYGGIVVTRSSTLREVNYNVIHDTFADAIAYDGSNTFPALATQGNALCAPTGVELRNGSAASVSAPFNWWGVNLPALNREYAGLVDPATPVTLAIRLGASRLPADGVSQTPLTLTLRAPNGETTPARALARQLRLATNLGSVAPAIVSVDDSGMAYATLTAAGGVGTATVTATAFCDYPVTATLALVGVDLMLEKTTALTQTLRDASLVYRVVYSNTSDMPAVAVALTDTLPAHTAWAADDATGLGWTRQVNGATVLWTRSELAPHTGGSFAVTLTVASAAPCGAPLANAATIGNAVFDTDLSDNTAAAAVTVICPALAVAKTGSALAQVGDSVTYTFRITNTSTPAASPALILDSVVDVGDGWPGLGNLTGVAAAQGCATLAPGAACAFTHTYLIPPTAPEVLSNTVTVHAHLAGFTNDITASARHALTVYRALDLVVFKDDAVGPTTPRSAALTPFGGAMPQTTAHREFVYEGDWVTYTIGVFNKGPLVATHIVITETLPLHVTYVEAGFGWTRVNSRTFTLTIAALPPFTDPNNPQGYLAYMVVRVADMLPGAVNNLDNLVCGWAATPELVPADNCNHEDTPVRPRPDLAIVKTTALSAVAPGKLLTYTLTYSNVGGADAPSVIITDTLPAHTTYAGDTSGFPHTLSGNTLAWTLPAAAAVGGGGAFELFVRVAPQPALCGLTVTNTAAIHTPLPERSLANNVASAPPVRITCFTDLVVVKDDAVGPTTPSRTLAGAADKTKRFAAWQKTALAVTQHREFVYEGDLVTYTISVFNAEAITATAAALTETLPEYSDYVEAGFGWTRVSTRTYTLNVGTLPPGAGYLTYMVVRVHDPAPEGINNLVNLVCGVSQEPDLYPQDNCNYEDTPLHRRPLRVAKTAPLCIAPGDYFNYTPYFTNTNALTAFVNAPVTDTLPAFVSYAGAAPGDWRCAGGLCRYMLSRIAAQSSSVGPPLSVRLSPTVPYTTVRAITNTIEISGGYRFTLVSPIDTGPDLMVVKNDNVGPLPMQARSLWNQVETTLFGRASAQLQAQRLYVRPGERITYTILYINSGVGIAHNVVVSEQLPDYTRYVGGGWMHAGGNRYVMDVGTLRRNEGGALTFVVEVLKPFPVGVDRILNQVEITGQEVECDTSNNRSNDDTPVETGVLLYVANGGSDTLDVFKASSFAHVASVAAGPTPFGMAQSGNRLFVANFEDSRYTSTVSILDLSTRQISAAPDVGRHPVHLAALDGYVYVANHSGGEGVSVIEAATGQVIARLRPHQFNVYDFGFFGAAADPTRGRVYVTKRYMGGVGLWVVTPVSDTFKLEWVINTGASAPNAVAYNPQTDRIYITFGLEDELRVYDPDTFALLATYRTQMQDPSWTGSGGHGLAVMGNCAYVSNYLAQSVTVLAEGPCGDSFSPTTPGGGVSIPGLNYRVYLPLVLSQGVVYPRLLHIPVNGHPKGMAAAGGVVFVTLSDENRIAVIDVRTLSVRLDIASQGIAPHTAFVATPD